MNAFKAIDSFEGRSELGTWLYRITYNNAMMRLRRPSPDAVSVDEALDGADEGYTVPQQFFDWCCLPEEDFDSEEVRRELEKAIGELSPSLSSVFILREMEGLSTRETAEALDVSEDVVKTRLRRARLQLRELLSDYFAEQEEVVSDRRYVFSRLTTQDQPCTNMKRIASICLKISPSISMGKPRMPSAPKSKRISASATTAAWWWTR